MSAEIHEGDWIDILRKLPDCSVHCVVTSPPYWGLRDYGVPPSIWGGDKECAHDWHNQRYYTEQTAAKCSSDAFSEAGEANAARLKEGRWRDNCWCTKCGAWRGCLGLEPTPEMFVQHITEGFREVRRVLRDDGTCWLNLGDCYATGAGKVGECPGGGEQGDKWKGYRGTRQDGKHAYIAQAVGPMIQPNRMPLPGLKPKDLVMMPARVALALQADGWWVRSDIIWAKPNGMPGSQQDRCTSSHETIFQFSKSERYWSDFDAIKTPPRESTMVRLAQDVQAQAGSHRANGGAKTNGPMKAVQRRTDKQRGHSRRHDGFNDRWDAMEKAEQQSQPAMMRDVWFVAPATFEEAHFAVMPAEIARRCILAGCPLGGTVFDPFCGAGTTGMVAKRLMRSFIGIELNPQYVEMARKRIVNDAPLFNEVSTFPQESQHAND